MKILALGATGAIGREMVSHLARGQNEIHVTTRKNRPNWGPVRYHQGDAQDEPFLQSLLREGWDTIVDFMVYDTPRFRQRVERLLENTEQYIFISSSRIFAKTQGLITERSPRLLEHSQDAAFLASDEYALTKARQEDILRDTGRKNWTIVRPYITFGEGRLQLGSLEKEDWLYRALRGRDIVFCSEMLDKWTTLTDGADVARMLTALVGQAPALGQHYNLTGRQAVTWREVMALYIDTLETHLEQTPKVRFLDLKSFSRISRTPSQIQYDRMYDRRFDTSKIDAIFDTSQLAPPLPHLRERLLAQLAEGSFLQHDWPMEALRDHACRQHARLDEIASPKARIAYLLCRYFPFAGLQMLRLK